MNAVRAPGLAIAVLLVAVFACDTQGPSPPKSSYKSYDSNLGLVATTEGDTLRTFPLSTEAYSETLYFDNAGRLVHFGNDYLFVRTPTRGRIFDVSTGEIVVELPNPADLGTSTAWHVTGRGHPGDLILLRQRTGSYAFADTVRIHDRVLRSGVHALRVAPDGDTTESSLFEATIRKRDSTHFVTTQIRAAVPYGDGQQLLYVRDREVTTVTPREGGDPILNPFFFERSLWHYHRGPGTHEKLLVFPPPAEDVPLELGTADISRNGTDMVYEEDGRAYYADVEADSAVCLNDDCEGPYGDRMDNPGLSPSGSHLVGPTHSCNTTYALIDLATRERSYPFATDYCNSTTVSWGPEGTRIFVSDRRKEKAGVWSVPPEPPPDGRRFQQRTLHLNVGDLLSLDPSFLHNAQLSRPVFLNRPQTFVVLVAPPR